MRISYSSNIRRPQKYFKHDMSRRVSLVKNPLSGDQIIYDFCRFRLSLLIFGVASSH